jgi:hypothetical protein
MDGDRLLVYLPAPTSVSLDMAKIATAQTARATWIDPRTGDPTDAGTCPTTGTRSFSVLQEWPDALLRVAAEDGPGR